MLEYFYSYCKLFNTILNSFVVVVEDMVNVCPQIILYSLAISKGEFDASSVNLQPFFLPKVYEPQETELLLQA